MDELLQFVRHHVERGSQLSDFCPAAQFDALGEIAAGDRPARFSEDLEWIRNAPRRIEAHHNAGENAQQRQQPCGVLHLEDTLVGLKTWLLYDDGPIEFRNGAVR